MVAHFINVTDGIFDMRAPGGEEITTLEVIGKMEAIPDQVTVAISSIFSIFTMDPVRGTVQRLARPRRDRRHRGGLQR